MYKNTPFKSKTYSNNMSWRDIPWAELARECLAEQEMMLATLESERQQRYARHIAAKEARWLTENPECGSYEGNFSEETPYTPSSNADKFATKRMASNNVIEGFLERLQFKSFSLPILQQIVAHIATLPLTTVSGEDYDKEDCENGSEGSCISGVEFYKSHFSRNEADIGLYNFLMYDKRSSYLDVQYKHPAKSYCSLVPLVLFAYKLKHGIPYSHWHRPDIRGLVNPKLADAMLYTLPDDLILTPETILEARVEGLKIKSGPKMGQTRSPSYTYKLWGKTGLSDLPEYAQVMASQIWCCHPSNRTKYMVLDWEDWDRIPAPLISTEVTGTVSDNFGYTPTHDMQPDTPW